MGPSSEHRPAGVRPEARPSSSTASGTLKSSILQEDVHTSGAGGGVVTGPAGSCKGTCIGQGSPHSCGGSWGQPPICRGLRPNTPSRAALPLLPASSPWSPAPAPPAWPQFPKGIKARRRRSDPDRHDSHHVPMAGLPSCSKCSLCSPPNWPR